MSLISIHSSQAGWDPSKYDPSSRFSQFQSTHPKRDETLSLANRRWWIWHFNPLIPSGMRPVPDEGPLSDFDISIHSSQAGWDWSTTRCPSYWIENYFNPLIPSGMRPACSWTSLTEIGFQSTHPKRDETTDAVGDEIHTSIFQSTHPKRDETLKARKLIAGARFQSTHPKRDETIASVLCIHSSFISIHSSQAGWDKPRRKKMNIITLFQSTHPKRDETKISSVIYPQQIFQSTHPKRDETVVDIQLKLTGQWISIHSSQAGWDLTIEIE